MVIIRLRPLYLQRSSHARIEQDPEWVPERDWTFRRRGKYRTPVGVPNSDLPARSLAVMPNKLAGCHQYVSLYFRRTITFIFANLGFKNILSSVSGLLLTVSDLLLTSVRKRMSTGGDCNNTSVLLKGRKILNSLIRYEVVQKNSP